MFSNKKKRDGISLRTLYIIILIGGVIISAVMLYTTHKLFNSFQNLTEASKQRIELRQAVRQLTDASDYLTEQVQRFTVLGDQRFLDAYFEEAFEANHREEAMDIVANGSATPGRDVKLLAGHGYEVQRATAGDMFPRTSHVECVVLMTKK